MAADMNGSDLRLGLLAVAVSSILFSCKSVFFKMCFKLGADPVTLQAMRAAVSMPFFIWPLLAHRFRSPGGRPAPLGRGDLAKVAGLGFVGYYMASIFDMVGLQYVSAGTERLILFIYPTLVVLFSAWMFRKRIPKAMYPPLLLSYAGIALAFGGEAAAPEGGRPYLGGFLVFLSAVFYAFFLVGQGRMIHRVGPHRLAALCMLVSCLAVFAHFGLTRPLSSLDQPAAVYWLAFLTSVFCSVVPVYLYGYGVKAVGAGKAAVVSSVGPVSTLALAGGILDERAGVLQWAGLGLVMAGSLKLGLDGSRPKRARAQPSPDSGEAVSAAGAAAAGASGSGAAARGRT